MATIKKKGSDRTALLIHCSRQEAEQIRRAAEQERRTISGFILNAVMDKFKFAERIEERRQNYRDEMVKARHMAIQHAQDDRELRERERERERKKVKLTKW